MRITWFHLMIGLVCLILAASLIASGCVSNGPAPVDNTGPRADSIEKTLPLREY